MEEEVQIGLKSDTRLEILSGLDPDDEVAADAEGMYKKREREKKKEEAEEKKKKEKEAEEEEKKEEETEEKKEDKAERKEGARD